MHFFEAGIHTHNGQKQTLPLDPARPDLERVRRDRLERNIQEIIQQALAEQRARVLEKVPESPEAFVAWAAQDLEQVLRRGEAELTKSELYDALRRALVDSVDLGVYVAVDQLRNVGLGFDWTLANNQARQWAEQHVGKLVTAITGTTRDSVRRSVGAWVVSGEPLSALVAELSPVFGPERAELIGSTEVTRAFAEGNRQAYLESGVVTRWVWRTAVDERVCFPAWTSVLTETGNRPIAEIQVGDRVWTRVGFRSVTAVISYPYQGSLVLVWWDNDFYVIATADHPFWTAERGWIPCSQLTIKDRLLTVKERIVPVSGIFIVRPASIFNMALRVYNLQVADVSEFYANGILVHNCPICGPLEGTTVAIGTPFNGFLPDAIAQRVKQQFDAPPSHPRCRCFLTPEVSGGD